MGEGRRKEGEQQPIGYHALYVKSETPRKTNNGGLAANILASPSSAKENKSPHPGYPLLLL